MGNIGKLFHCFQIFRHCISVVLRRSKTSKDQRPERRQRMVRLRFLGATDWFPEFPTEIMLIKDIVYKCLQDVQPSHLPRPTKTLGLHQDLVAEKENCVQWSGNMWRLSWPSLPFCERRSWASFQRCRAWDYCCGIKILWEWTIRAPQIATRIQYDTIIINHHGLFIIIKH